MEDVVDKLTNDVPSISHAVKNFFQWKLATNSLNVSASTLQKLCKILLDTINNIEVSTYNLEHNHDHNYNHNHYLESKPLYKLNSITINIIINYNLQTH